MPAPSLRDRFFTPPVARAIMSPLGILLAGAGASIGILVGLPIAGAAALGALAWGGRVAAAVPRAPEADRIDPFSLSDPWRGFVQAAQQSRGRFDDAVRRARSGPLRDRLKEIGDRLDEGVRECWRIACSGDALTDARKQIDARDVQRQLDQVTGEQRGPVSEGSPQAGTISALEAQLATARRLETTITNARDKLRLLDARMDEAVARAIELSVSADEDALDSLSADVDGIVGDMEALRQGIDEADRASDIPGTATGTA
jgi:hypothetical protein